MISADEVLGKDRRFTGRDPVNLSTVDPYAAPYAYADDSPTALVDPSGMVPEE